jgi:hypothetical protein
MLTADTVSSFQFPVSSFHRLEPSLLSFASQLSYPPPELEWGTSFLFQEMVGVGISIVEEVDGTTNDRDAAEEGADQGEAEVDSTAEEGPGVEDRKTTMYPTTESKY